MIIDGERYYTAEEIGALLGISAEKVNEIAKTNGIMPRKAKAMNTAVGLLGVSFPEGSVNDGQVFSLNVNPLHTEESPYHEETIPAST